MPTFDKYTKLYGSIPERQFITKLKAYPLRIRATINKDLLVAFLNQDGVAAIRQTFSQFNFLILS